MTKTITAILGSMLLLASPAVMQAQSGSGDGFNYSINASNANTLTITSYTGTNPAVIIPTNINNLLVTGIGNPDNYPVFSDSLTSVTIPGSVTSIGEEAFDGCSALTNAIIANGVTSIGDWAFASCFLTGVTIPNSVTTIGEGAFSDNGLTNVTIPNSVTNFGGAAFSSCFKLTSVTIGNGITGIVVDAFFDCYNLTNITIPNSVTNIGEDAFAFCSLTSITIPCSVIYLGDGAFHSCSSLTSVYFEGNAPTADSTVFQYGYNGAYDPTTVYYLPGTLGWDVFLANTSIPTVAWWLPYPVILTGVNASFVGVQTNRFGFIISWATNHSVVVEACTNLANPVWISLQTVTLTNGSYYFSDPQWTNYTSRFYGLGFP